MNYLSFKPFLKLFFTVTIMRFLLTHPVEKVTYYICIMGNFRDLIKTYAVTLAPYSSV